MTPVVLIGAGLGGWQWWERKNGAQTNYLTALVQRGDIEDVVTATGLLQPRDYVDVGAQVSGQLTKIHVEVGSEVKAGQLLAEIGAEQSAARVKANRASLRAQRATLAQRQVELAKADRDWRRQKNLLADEATTAEAVQNAETTVLSTRAQIQALEAQIEQADATMQVEEANLKYAQIYAPMAGTVVSLSARQGQTLNANQSAPTLLRIADMSTMTVQAQVSEADVSRLRVGMPVYFTTLGSSGQRWQSTLNKVEPTPTVINNVVLYNALFDVPNAGRRLMPQMTAQVFFIVAQARNALTVPVAALTLQRRPMGGVGGAAAGGAPGAGGPGAASSGAAPGAAMAAQAGSGSGASGASAGSGARPDWQNLSPEERERMRAERRARGEMGGGNGGGGNAGGAGSGNAGGPPPVRRATVRVQAADGSVQEREVQVGVSSRVLAEVLAGLNEGERVVTGQRQAGAPAGGAGGSGSGGGGQQQRSGAPGGMPPGGMSR